MPQPVTSPDERYALRFSLDSMGLSGQICSPVLVDLIDDRVLFTLAGTMWTTEVAVWTDDSQMLVMSLRRFPGITPAVCVRVEVRQKLACLDDSAYSLPLNQLFERLEARYQGWLSANAGRRKK